MNFYDSYTTPPNRNTRVYSTGADIQKTLHHCANIE